MKAIVKASKTSKKWRAIAEERRELLNSNSNHQPYTQPPTSPLPTNSLSKSSTSLSAPTKKTSQPTRKISNNEFFESRGAPDHREVSDHTLKWVSENPTIQIRPNNHPSAQQSKSISELTELDFEKLPFSSYTREVESWGTALLQAMMVTAGCALAPAVLIVFTLIITKWRWRPTMKAAEEKKENMYFCISIPVALMKDIMVVVAILSCLNHLPIAIAYAPIVFACCVCLFVFPQFLFYYADAKYVFKYDQSQKVNTQTLSFYNNPQVRDKEMKKMELQDKYFVKYYPLLSSITASNHELDFVRKATSKIALISFSAVSLIICIIRNIAPLILDIFSPPITPLVAPITSNATVVSNLFKPVVIISSVNSIFVSMFLSIFMLYIILWKITILREWRHFNEIESDSENTSTRSGSQGIAMWWKIRQTLQFFSTSVTCMSVLIGQLFLIISIIAVTCISVALIVLTMMSMRVQLSFLLSLLIDNLLLYIFVLIMSIFEMLTWKEQVLATHSIAIKKLNIAYEISCSTNLDQKAADKEHDVRQRSRLLRGRLSLMQNLTSHLQNEEANNDSMLRCSYPVIVTLLAVGSVCYALGYMDWQK